MGLFDNILGGIGGLVGGVGNILGGILGGGGPGGGGGLGGILPTLGTIGGTVYDYMTQKDIADTLQTMAASPIIDPFGAQNRAAFQGRLQSLYADPSGLENLPGYRFTRDQGLQAVQRQMAKGGKFYSTNILDRTADYVTGLAQRTYADERNALARMAGADFPPMGGVFGNLMLQSALARGELPGIIGGGLGQLGMGMGGGAPGGVGGGGLFGGLLGPGGLLGNIFGGGGAMPGGGGIWDFISQANPGGGGVWAGGSPIDPMTGLPRAGPWPANQPNPFGGGMGGAPTNMLGMGLGTQQPTAGLLGGALNAIQSAIPGYAGTIAAGAAPSLAAMGLGGVAPGSSLGLALSGPMGLTGAGGNLGALAGVGGISPGSLGVGAGAGATGGGGGGVLSGLLGGPGGAGFSLLGAALPFGAFLGRQLGLFGDDARLDEEARQGAEMVREAIAGGTRETIEGIPGYRVGEKFYPDVGGGLQMFQQGMIEPHRLAGAGAVFANRQVPYLSVTAEGTLAPGGGPTLGGPGALEYIRGQQQFHQENFARLEAERSPMAAHTPGTQAYEAYQTSRGK